ncbi:HAMP domain-containing sensor histidine kinase [Geotalea sp. SG265]|uniref:sensor histidine kinase n=1 Tax=Geotalea sp. SG265 TaxID=2922867 RepID=UPI001FAF345F|nr:HAMP domain-containing sensor histidine kinase [Geotalea sp. SG265]
MNLQKLKRSFRFRLFAVFTVTTALITALFTVLLVKHEIATYRLQVTEKAHLLASLLANTIRLPLYAEDRQTLEQLARETARKPEVLSVIITNQDGKVLVELTKQKSPNNGTITKVSVGVSSASMATSAKSALTGDGAEESNSIGSVRLHLNSENLPEKIRETIIFTSALALIFWLSVLGLGFIALKQVTRSFNALMQGVERIRHGDYSARIATHSNDEPEQAAMAINDLAATLQNRELENAKLQAELFNAMKMEVREEKRLLMAKLIQTNRMTSLGLLVSSMAHEINNPNGAIRLAAQYLNRAWKDTAPVLEGVAREEGDFSIGGIPLSVAAEEVVRSGESIIRNTERIEAVIRNLRSYSLGERNELRPDMDINGVINDALAVIRAHGRHGNLEIAAELAPDLPLVNGNRHQMEQVVINLLLNAIQATPDESGTINLLTAMDRAAGEVLISVKDEGVGILPEHRERIYEPFFSTRIDNGGSGLGLYISNFIITEHQGRLEVSSSPGAGSTFTIRLPVPPQAA